MQTLRIEEYINSAKKIQKKKNLFCMTVSSKKYKEIYKIST